MSTACKELIPLLRAMKETTHACGSTREEKASSAHTTIWKDNVGALTLARLELPQITPRSEVITGVCYHCFFAHITSSGWRNCTGSKESRQTPRCKLQTFL